MRPPLQSVNDMLAFIARLLGPGSTVGAIILRISNRSRDAIRLRLAWLARFCAYTGLLGRAMLRAGFGVAFIPILAVLLLSSPGSDYMVGLAVDTGFNHPAWYRWGGAVAWVALWVFATWFWCMMALATIGPAPNRPPLLPARQDAYCAWLTRWLATVIGGLGGFVVAACFVIIRLTSRVDSHAAQLFWVAAAGILAATVAVLLAADAIYRAVAKAWQGANDPDGALILCRWAVSSAGLVVFAAFLVGATRDPVGTAAFWGGAFNLVLVAAMAWAGVGTTLILLGDAWNVPLPLFALFLFVAVSSGNSQHRLVTMPESAPPHDLAAAYTAWRQRNPPDAPLVLVATAGGGLRAAYWTATVLGTLRDTYPSFGKTLFAISGVSGGSVGASVYAALSAHGKASCGGQGPALTPCLQRLLGQDLLGPTIAGFLFTDVFQSFIPTGIVRLPDRAHALEMALATGWAANFTDGSAPYTAPLSALYDHPAGPVPELLLNGTSVATGRRMITASLAMPLDEFPAAIDLRTAYSFDVPLAEAAMNSARFPYVTPVAGISFGGHDDEIADGGYFENFGATTIQDVLHWVRARPSQDQPSRIVVIAITSDDTLPQDAPFWPANTGKGCARPARSRADIGPLLPQLAAPVAALYNSRAGHGALAAERLLAATAEVPGARYIPFRLVSELDEPGVPLSWSLSDKARGILAAEMKKCPNSAALTQLSAALGPPGVAVTQKFGENQPERPISALRDASHAGGSKP
jgi:hypothetical protein